MAPLIYDYSSLDSFLGSLPAPQELLLALTTARKYLILAPASKNSDTLFYRARFLKDLQDELNQLLYPAT